jgi:hypothetical protein
VIFSAIVMTFMFICFFTIAFLLLHKNLFFDWELQGEKDLAKFSKFFQLSEIFKKVHFFFFYFWEGLVGEKMNIMPQNTDMVFLYT